jgi:hypothetical protein
MANYSHARISFDQAIGKTLETSGISVEEAVKGSLTSVVSKPAPEVKR